VLRETLRDEPHYRKLGLEIVLHPWQKGEGQAVDINFPGTIIPENQREFCVFMDRLEEKLPEFTEIYHKPKEKIFMSKEQKEFNEFYTVHIYRRVVNKKKKQSEIPDWKISRSIKLLSGKTLSPSSNSKSVQKKDNKICDIEKDYALPSRDTLSKSIMNGSYYRSGVEDVYYIHSVPDNVNGLLHSVLRAGHHKYKARGKELKTILQRKEFANGFRSGMIDTITNPVKSSSKLDKPYKKEIPYWCVCDDSRLSIQSMSDETLLLTYIQEYLENKDKKFTQNYLWFLSNEPHILANIYLLKEENKSLYFTYVTSRKYDRNLVIVEVKGNYVIFCKSSGETHFDNNHPFIELIDSINPRSEDEAKVLSLKKCIEAFVRGVIEKYVREQYLIIFSSDIMDSYLKNYIKSALPLITQYCDDKGIGYDINQLNRVLSE
jgi:hypothetical protein